MHFYFVREMWCLNFIFYFNVIWPISDQNEIRAIDFCVVDLSIQTVLVSIWILIVFDLMIFSLNFMTLTLNYLKLCRQNQIIFHFHDQKGAVSLLRLRLSTETRMRRILNFMFDSLFTGSGRFVIIYNLLNQCLKFQMQIIGRQAILLHGLWNEIVYYTCLCICSLFGFIMHWE